MKASRKKIAEVILGRLDSGESLNKLAREVAAYLLAENRSKELESIMRDVIALRAKHGITEVSVTSAHELDANIKKDIKDLVKSVRPGSTQILIDEKLSPDLIGGIKLSIINQSLDLSIRAKLNKLKQLTNTEGVS
ncbi:MAG TPA: F0F1 ATP synthase subunit delta [Candidatus Saccharimonadales bacterium]|jgi:F0F1-type ATP synthase delta subunit